MATFQLQLSSIGEDATPSPENNLRVAGIRRTAFSLVVPADCMVNGSTTTDNGNICNTTSTSTDVTSDDTVLPVPAPVGPESTTSAVDKPSIANVRLLKRPSAVDWSTSRRRPRTTLDTGNCSFRTRTTLDDCFVPRVKRTSSTFNDVPLHKVFIDLGDYQTLLRPPTIEDDDNEADDEAGERSPKSVKDVDDVDDGQPTTSPSRPTPTYIMPRQFSYGDETLQAISVITDKYDSFRRRQQRVRSFLVTRSRGSTLSRDSRSTTTTTASGTCRCDESTTSRTSTAASRVRQRIAADHKMALRTSDADVEASHGGQATASEIERVRLINSCVASIVVVCASLSDLFVGAAAAAGRKSRDSATDTQTTGITKSDSTATCGWVHLLTGIAVFVLNTGEGRRRRELYLTVADRATGLPLWTDRISYLSDYRQISPGVHTMHVSGGLTKRVRLTMFSRAAADEFLDAYRKLTSDPSDSLWKLSDDQGTAAGAADKRRNRKQKENNKKVAKAKRQASTDVARVRRPPLTTADISRPCDARWITRVDETDANFRSAFSAYLPVATSTTTTANGTVAPPPTDGSNFRARLPTN